ncbi:hypothetical protein AAFX91_21765 [Bradyrhizobium sp. 31Argb]|uniref:hypothetical protein n=1 Tax=Bradyrhizobium sp. 31Argb TaxID=3141247 RepID=UPI00374A6858
MYRIEHFAPVFEIAFTLSALFYYVELREVAVERLRDALDTIAAAQTSAEQAIKDRIRDLIKTDIPPGGMLSLSSRTKEVDAKLSDLESEKERVMLQWIFLRWASRMIAYCNLTTHALAVLSTVVSLGALVYSGFDPHRDFGWQDITILLAMSYASITWNLLFYMLALPGLNRALAS